MKPFSNQKKYKLVQRDENFNDFLSIFLLNFDSSGLSWVETKLAKQFRTVTESTKTDDGFFHLKTNVKIFTRDQKFQPSVEIIQKNVGGSLVKNILWIEGNRLIEQQIGAKM